MTYPESSYLIKLTSSESSTRNDYPIYIKTINSKPAEHTKQIGCIIAEQKQYL